MVNSLMTSLHFTIPSITVLPGSAQQKPNWILILGLHFFLLIEETTVADLLAFGFARERKVMGKYAIR